MGKKINLILEFNQDLEKALKKKFPKLEDFRILSKSLDARKSNQGRTPRYNYLVEVKLSGETFSKYVESFPQLGALPQKPIIVGAGPGGLFCALRLAEYGIPSILIERGGRAQERMKKIAKFWRYGEFDGENNVCFGEGGAGLFSDGKLITRIKSPFIKYVMHKMVEFGAPPEIEYLANPHLGSNKIRPLINKITDYLKTVGCEIHYHSKVTKILSENSIITGVTIKTDEGEQDLFSPNVVLATGHSAKDLYYHFREQHVSMKPKDFAIGVRIEHPREVIDHLQLGNFAKQDSLKSARYALSFHDKTTDHGTYSFCMCPGGYVLSSGTEDDGLVVNGMSNYARGSRWSNSAIVVTVKADEDFSTKDNVLAGLDFIKEIEHKAFNLSKEQATGRELPAITVEEFLNDSLNSEPLPKTSTPSGIFKADLREIFPPFVIQHLKNALKNFDKKMKGFIHPKSILIAPETRTSAPVTITRDKETLESLTHKGLYPCGEGAGYAGGITSSAVDGIKVAMAIINKEF
ncbi:MAG: hypothetical protein E2O68_09315 [Deltaproteobacteria bacterium]|nr:MAG: hypothetical protein E2O68_09315 [Deltaproteobacteria bacterium]